MHRPSRTAKASGKYVKTCMTGHHLDLKRPAILSSCCIANHAAATPYEWSMCDGNSQRHQVCTSDHAVHATPWSAWHSGTHPLPCQSCAFKQWWHSYWPWKGDKSTANKPLHCIATGLSWCVTRWLARATYTFCNVKDPVSSQQHTTFCLHKSATVLGASMSMSNCLAVSCQLRQWAGAFQRSRIYIGVAPESLHNLYTIVWQYCGT